MNSMISSSFVLIGGHRHSEFNNMDIGNIGGNEENSNMDSEDLVPSLQVNVPATGLHFVYSNFFLFLSELKIIGCNFLRPIIELSRTSINEL